MDRNAVYHKTEKGLEEIRSRSFRLPARERSVLILVDGKGAARDIIDKAKHFGDAEQFFTSLINGGFIVPVAAAVPASAPAVPSRTPTPTAGGPDAAKSLASAKDFAAFFLVKVVGPQADAMTGHIEKCNDAEQFQQVIEKYREVVRAAGGNRKAEEFRDGAMSRLP